MWCSCLSFIEDITTVHFWLVWILRFYVYILYLFTSSCIEYSMYTIYKVEDYFMNRISGFLFYSLIFIYLRAFLHHSSCAKDLEKGLHFLYVHCIQLYSRSLYTALKMFHHTNGKRAPEFQGEPGWGPDWGSFQAYISEQCSLLVCPAPKMMDPLRLYMMSPFAIMVWFNVVWEHLLLWNEKFSFFQACVYASVAWNIKGRFWFLELIYDVMQYYCEMTELLASVF